MDGGLKRRAQAETISVDNGGKRARAKMDPVATTRSLTRTEKGRKRGIAAIQGAGEEICDVEAAGHVGPGEGMEDSSNRGRKMAI